MVRKVSNGFDLQSQRIQNLADPSTGTDAATKQYVDSVARGLSWHDEVYAASTANVNIASAPSTLDGATLPVLGRVLLKNQTTASENGVYVFASAGAALTRAADMAAGATEPVGAAVSVATGTVNGNTIWHVTTPAANSVAVGTTATTWSQLGGGTAYTGGNGISISGGTITAVAGTGISVGGGGIAIDTSVVARKFSANIGDGSSTTITVTHNLGTRDVEVEVYDAATFDEIIADVNHATTNTVTVTFATAPASNAYRVVVVG